MDTIKNKIQTRTMADITYLKNTVARGLARARKDQAVRETAARVAAGAVARDFLNRSTYQSRPIQKALQGIFCAKTF